MNIVFKANFLNLFSIVVILICVFSCKETQKNEVASLTSNVGDYAVEVSMEGKVFQIKQENLEPIIKTVFKKDSIQLIFWEDGNPLQFNFNLTHTDILEKGAATYIIPDVNAGKVKVDLNFYNADRDSKRTNKRIIFRNGTIAIKKLTEHKLEMTFKGEGGGMLDRKNSFPISGKVSVTY